MMYLIDKAYKVTPFTEGQIISNKIFEKESDEQSGSLIINYINNTI